MAPCLCPTDTQSGDAGGPRGAADINTGPRRGARPSSERGKLQPPEKVLTNQEKRNLVFLQLCPPSPSSTVSGASDRQAM